MDQAGASGDKFGDLHGLFLEKSTRGFAGKKTALAGLANLALLEPSFLPRDEWYGCTDID